MTKWHLFAICSSTSMVMREKERERDRESDRESDREREERARERGIEREKCER